MRHFGFSSFVLDPDPFRAQEKAATIGCTAIEFSALREHELKDILNTAKSTTTTWFDYISIHLPKRLEIIEESSLVTLVQNHIQTNPFVNFIVHPNIITDYGLWQQVQNYILIENLDYSTDFAEVNEIESFFHMIPRAGLCFDFAHAINTYNHTEWQYPVDFIYSYGGRLGQFHISSLEDDYKHARLKNEEIPIIQDTIEYCKAEKCLSVPVIIESPVKNLDEAREELEKVRGIFDEQT